MTRLSAHRAAAFTALLSAAVAVLLLWSGPPGTDLAAHTYQRELFLHHGFVFWNNFWYAGRYSFVTYSLLYYPLAAALGIPLLAVVSIAVATFAFTLVVGHEWGETGRWPSVAFAAVWACIVLSAAFPFALGVALALLSLSALQMHANWRFAGLAGLALAASPVSFLLLTLVLAAALMAQRVAWRRLALPAVAVAGIVGAELVLRRLFPYGGRFPFPVAEFAAVCAFCLLGAALTKGVPRARILHALFIVYLLAATAVFVVPSAIGENIARLRLVAIPVALLTVSLRGWRPLLISWVAVGLAFSWNLAPVAESLASSRSNPTSEVEFWRPAVRFLKARSNSGYRVEVVDSRGHWGAAYLPQAGLPVARGWFRQDDFPLNGILYRRFNRGGYLRWLHRLAVRYVVLPRGPLDYSARREAALLRSGRSGLRVVWRSATTTIYAVPSPRPLVSGPHRAAVAALSQSQVRLDVGGSGTYRIAIRSSPYWHDRADVCGKVPIGCCDWWWATPER